ncbi:hypothetical protein DFH07DRAFT_957247 [Mycena maculata]|uniref:Uncharacterized protein n=1 Tax=Mycena maculata TaxID=230809 RepID=A0AAD7NGC5_9AGAR|nr:hypothetical protein DFH07DRAFT_957247 [Mycena maculata]
MSYRCEPPFYPDPDQPPDEPLLRRRLYLVCGRNVKHPGAYVSWPSAEAEYTGVSSATVKAYSSWSILRSAWYKRCDLGEHNHPVDPHLETRVIQPSTSPPLPPSGLPPSAPSVVWIESRSPSPETSGTGPPPYTLSASAVPAYMVRVGSEGEIFSDVDEALAVYNDLLKTGRKPRFVVADSIADCFSWIVGADSSAGAGQ